MDFQLNLDTETVNHAYPADPDCVESGTVVRDVLQKLKADNRGAVLICADKVLKGIFTERDALRLMASSANLDMPIDEVMVADPVTLTLSDTVGTAISKMSSGGYRRLPIVNKECQPVGILKVSGILHYLVEHFPKIVYNLPPKPHHAAQEREGA